MARPKCCAVYGSTALSISPSRTCRCQSSGLRMVIRVVIGASVITERAAGNAARAAMHTCAPITRHSPAACGRSVPCRPCPAASSARLSSSATAVRGKAAAVPTSAMAQPSSMSMTRSNRSFEMPCESRTRPGRKPTGSSTRSAPCAANSGWRDDAGSAAPPPGRRRQISAIECDPSDHPRQRPRRRKCRRCARRCGDSSSAASACMTTSVVATTQMVWVGSRAWPIHKAAVAAPAKASA